MLEHQLCLGTKFYWAMKGGEEAGKNYRGPIVRKVADGPTVLQNVLSLSSLPLSADCTNHPFQPKPKSLCNWQSVF